MNYSRGGLKKVVYSQNDGIDRVYKKRFSKENKSNLIKEHLSYVNTAGTKAQRELN